MDQISLISRVCSVIFLAISTLLAMATSILGDTFGSGANTFNIEFVTVGNPGNPADTTGTPNPAGAVPYDYRIGKYEISEQMIDKANLLGGLGITTFDFGPDKPATFVSWNEAARFVNWLNVSTGSPPAYKFAVQPESPGYDPNAYIHWWAPTDAGYDPNNLYRNDLARYFLPSMDEWYKAAYYEPTGGTYYDYPTGSDSPPTPVVSGVAPETAVFSQPNPADVDLAGGLSPYGTMGQGGNVWEWEETYLDLGNSVPLSIRAFRGGGWNSNADHMTSWIQGISSPTVSSFLNGFRVASVAVVPEPTTLLFAIIGLVSGVWTVKRRR